MDAILNIDAIQQIIPHRYPFLLVDKVIEKSEDGYYQVAVKNTTFNEPYFQGHFPGYPIMPGVLQIEALAQAGGIMTLTLESNPDVPKGGFDTFLMSVEKAKFRKPVRPGDQLFLETTLLSLRRNTAKIQGIVRVDGKVVTEAEIMFMLVPKEKR
ncbi:MAG: 3-hydroxyacyl-ACP dehydratase FabZ [Kiritimatiellae bacterium]|mgnify:FL=1|nr:3-hydroxyacyl-ACP dehydratase FabZ [Kiritimatiellia bacterium]